MIRYSVTFLNSWPPLRATVTVTQSNGDLVAVIPAHRCLADANDGDMMAAMQPARERGGARVMCDGFLRRLHFGWREAI